MKPAAFQATFSDFKLIKGRKVVQWIFETPLEHFDAGYQVTGMPQPASEQWFAIARLNNQPRKATDPQGTANEMGQNSSQPRQVIATAKPTRRSWDELTPTQQAGIRCHEAAYATFLAETHFDEWHDSFWQADVCVRSICDVPSRAELTTNPDARKRWLALENQYQAWLALEANPRLGASQGQEQEE